MHISMLPVAASLVLAGTCVADTLHVPKQYPTIQSAIDASSDGDTIAIDAGTYPEHTVSPGGRAITIRGTIGADGTPLTIIDAQRNGSVLMCNRGETQSTVFENLHLTGGNNWLGGGLSCSFSTSATVINCEFVNNHSPQGGGAFRGVNTNSVFTDCMFDSNTAFVGGAFFCKGGVVQMTNCRVANNGYGGIYSYVTWFQILDSTICGNEGYQITGEWADLGGNTITNTCMDCPDVTGDGTVNVDDLLAVISDWGCEIDCYDWWKDCCYPTWVLSDLDGSGVIDVSDLLLVISGWGPCP